MPKRLATLGIARLLMLAVVLASAPMARASGDYESPKFRPEELDQMLAPVALYPDSLLSQVLMAATYPEEVKEAGIFAFNNSNLTGDSLVKEAADQDWDPSVKALLEFPDIVGMMHDQMNWTTNLGDALLGQQRDVMESVQRLRANAQMAGNLNTTKQQAVSSLSGTSGITFDPVVIDPITMDPITIDPITIDPIVINPIDSDFIFPPVYDSAAVYGTWWWPAYPPYAYYPAAWVPGAGVGFWTGVAVGRNWNWGGWDWSRREVKINPQNFNSWTQNHYADSSRYQRNASVKSQTWQHDPSHRRDEPYRDRSTAQRFGQADRVSGSERAGDRGFDRSGQQGFDGRDRAGDRGADRTGPRGQEGRDRAAERGLDPTAERDLQRGDRAGDRDLDRQGGRDFDRSGAGDARRSAFDGAGVSGGDRAASMRGMNSRGGASVGAPSRPAGGFGGGGRRR